MIGRIMDFIEDSDPVVLITVAFSVIFFAVVITKAVQEVKKRVRKEKAITKLEEKYDNLCQHRNNLIVSESDHFNEPAPLLLGKGRWRVKLG